MAGVLVHLFAFFPTFFPSFFLLMRLLIDCSKHLIELMGIIGGGDGKMVWAFLVNCGIYILCVRQQEIAVLERKKEREVSAVLGFGDDDDGKTETSCVAVTALIMYEIQQIDSKWKG